jgi:hypothetical protein
VSESHDEATITTTHIFGAAAEFSLRLVGEGLAHLWDIFSRRFAVDADRETSFQTMTKLIGESDVDCSMNTVK